MNNLPRQKLCEIVARCGSSIVEDRRRCEGLLRDYSGAYRREIAVLAGAIDERVAADLLAAHQRHHGGMPRQMLLTQLAQRLHDNLAMDQRAAQWAVNSWALALGVISNAELEAIERTQPEQTQAQPAQPNKPPPPLSPPPQNQSKPAQPKQAPVKLPKATPPPVTTTTAAAAQPKPAQAAAARTSSDIIVAPAGGGGDYPSINLALRAMASGARLIVRPGVYRESIVINKPVEIIGDGARQNIVIESTNGSCFLMRTNEAVISGLTLREMAGISNAGEGFFAVDVPQGHLTVDDCDITSNSLSCIGIHNSLTDPVIRRCTIHSSADSGVYIFNDANGTLEECDIYNNSNVGVAITERARPVIKRCTIRDGQNAGVVVWNGGVGVVEECEIYGNAKAGVGISEEGDPVIRRCRIYGGENSGVFVHDNGRGTLEECDISRHTEAEVAVTGGGNLVALGCKIHQGRLSGVFLRDAGRALLEMCSVYGNASAGIDIHADSVAVIRQCNINQNGKVAIRVEMGGAVDVENSNLTGNRVAAFETGYGSLVESRGNTL